MSKNQLVMYGVGDVAPYREDLSSSFAHVRELFRESDLTFGQLESVLSETGPLSSCTRMGCSSRPEVVPVLKEAGFDVISFASNHALDYGRDAFRETLKHLRDAGLYVIGAGENEETACRMYSFPHPDDLEKMLNDIREAKQKADLILGHHAHILKPIEMYKGKAIFYSLGNFAMEEVTDMLRDVKAKGQDMKTSKSHTEMTAISDTFKTTKRLWVWELRSMDEQEDERILKLLKAGLVLPPWKDKSQGRGVGGGYAQSGLGLGPSLVLLLVDYTKILDHGTLELIEQARECQSRLRFTDAVSIDKFRYYRAVIMAFEAMNTLADRYSRLAYEMAYKEKDPVRRAELQTIGETCAWVPRHKPRTFREAIQCFWFQFLMLSPSTTLPGGRFDQYMYPYYKADLEAGRITREEAVELLCCMRLKDMELNRTSGKNNRKKNAGFAKWHNFVIGGVKPDGTDATNDLSYMLLDAALITRTPHHTITLRVAPSTPKELLLKGAECIKAGLSMPAFISDESYTEFFTMHGVSVEDARDFAITGCLDANLPGSAPECTYVSGN